jgi:hypothetical protein
VWSFWAHDQSESKEREIQDNPKRQQVIGSVGDRRTVETFTFFSEPHTRVNYYLIVNYLKEHLILSICSVPIYDSVVKKHQMLIHIVRDVLSLYQAPLIPECSRDITNLEIGSFGVISPNFGTCRADRNYVNIQFIPNPAPPPKLQKDLLPPQ